MTADPHPLDDALHDLAIAVAQLDNNELTYSRDYFGGMARNPALNTKTPRTANVIGAFAALFTAEHAHRAGSAEATALADVLDDEP